MIIIKTIEDLIKAMATVDATKFVILPPSFILRERVRHLVEVELPKIENQRPQHLHAGEMEMFIMEPLFTIASAIVEKSEFQRGSAVAQFVDLARRFGIVSEVLATVGASKPMMDAMGDVILRNMPLATTLGLDDKKDIKEQQGRATAYQYLTKAVALQDKQVTAWAELLPGRVAATTPTDIQNTAQQIMIYGATGRGAYLPTSKYWIQMKKRSIIELAIKSLYDPSIALRPGLEASPYYEDAYVLTIAYMAYCYNSSTPELYDNMFPPSAVNQTTAIRATKQQSVARKLAMFYSGVASAVRISDAALSCKLVRNSMQFFEPMIKVKDHIFTDLEAELTRAEQGVQEFSFAPVSAHLDFVFSNIKKITGADVLLPSYIEKYIDLPLIKMPDDVTIPTGSLNIHTSNVHRSWISPATIDNFLSNLYTIAHNTRATVDDLAAQMMYYYSMSVAYSPSEMQLPADLLAGNVPVHTLDSIDYSSIFEKAFAPLAVPRYTYKDTNNNKGEIIPSRTGRPMLEKFVNQPILIAAYRRSLRTKAGRFVFDVTRSIPLGATLGHKFSVIPIPHYYARQAVYTSVSNTPADIQAVMKTAITPSGPVAAFFEDAASIIAFNSSQAQSVIDALAGLCQVQELTGNKTVNLSPAIPTIYGIPANAFMEKQRVANAPYLDVNVTDAFSKTKKKMRFIFHSFCPDPARLISTPFLIESGAFVQIPVLAEVYMQARQGMADPDVMGTAAVEYNLSTKVTDDFIEALRSIPLKAIEGIVWVQITAWSTVQLAYPHLFFEFEDSYSNWYATPGNEASLHRKIMRIFSAHTTAMMVQSAIDHTIAIPMFDDVIKVADEGIPSVTAQSDTIIPSSGLSDPKRPVNDSPTRPIHSPEHLLPSTEDAQDLRSVTTSVLKPGAEGLKPVGSSTDVIDPATSQAYKPLDTNVTPKGNPTPEDGKPTRAAGPNDTLLGDADKKGDDRVDDDKAHGRGSDDSENESDTDKDLTEEEKKKKKKSKSDDSNADQE